jgi:hypothetical protein
VFKHSAFLDVVLGQEFQSPAQVADIVGDIKFGDRGLFGVILPVETLIRVFERLDQRVF